MEHAKEAITAFFIDRLDTHAVSHIDVGVLNLHNMEPSTKKRKIRHEEIIFPQAALTRIYIFPT